MRYTQTSYSSTFSGCIREIYSYLVTSAFSVGLFTLSQPKSCELQLLLIHPIAQIKKDVQERLALKIEEFVSLELKRQLRVQSDSQETRAFCENIEWYESCQNVILTPV